MAVRRNRLHIYTSVGGVDTLFGHAVFYSHRAGGPYYCWSYAKTPGRWRFSRVQPSVSMLKALRVANLKDTPTALQTKLDEHYL